MVHANFWFVSVFLIWAKCVPETILGVGKVTFWCLEMLPGLASFTRKR